MTGSSAAAIMPVDQDQATLVGRLSREVGPSPILVRGGQVWDVSSAAPTLADLFELPDPAAVTGELIGSVDELIAGSLGTLLAPIDLQVVKAAGVTFALSAIERVIEERARGDHRQAQDIRERIEQRIGGAIRAVVPGSPDAAKLKAALIEDGLWSQYLEVAIGPDAEIFTKTALLASVGTGVPIGVRSDSTWNNPEPEAVLVVSSRGEIRGATLGNDVNLRDFEGRSALLLSKAKDNNASCALGPLIRLFDDYFTLDDVRNAVVELEIVGEDGFVLSGSSEMSQISRDPAELVRQAMSEHHYPDGFVLFLGTLFAPVKDRDEVGRGFTHKAGDIVRISSPRLGTLENTVTTSRDAPAWAFGVRDLMRNLARRGLLHS
nr:fumarylacetoacetate hydrolase family protein [uncultured Sphingomonas sp.]